VKSTGSIQLVKPTAFRIPKIFLGMIQVQAAVEKLSPASQEPVQPDL
jgi:hypothetical protein